MWLSLTMSHVPLVVPSPEMYGLSSSLGNPLSATYSIARSGYPPWHPKLLLAQETSVCSESDTRDPVATLMAPSIAPVAEKDQQLPGMENP